MRVGELDEFIKIFLFFVKMLLNKLKIMMENKKNFYLLLFVFIIIYGIFVMWSMGYIKYKILIWLGGLMFYFEVIFIYVLIIYVLGLYNYRIFWFFLEGFCGIMVWLLFVNLED